MVCGANWLDEEDAQLARSWLHTSMNPIFANSMKRDQFWDKAAEHFNENTSGQQRVASSLKNRYAFSLFLACWNLKPTFDSSSLCPAGHTSDLQSQSFVGYMLGLNVIHLLEPSRSIGWIKQKHSTRTKQAKYLDSSMHGWSSMRPQSWRLPSKRQKLQC